MSAASRCWPARLVAATCAYGWLAAARVKQGSQPAPNVDRARLLEEAALEALSAYRAMMGSVFGKGSFWNARDREAFRRLEAVLQGGQP